jgi:hypothetical protein
MNHENPPPAPIPTPPEDNGQLVLYRTQDGRTRITVRLIQESVWLTLNQIADLFQRDKSVISKHIKNIFVTGELNPDRTVAKFATVQIEGGRSVTREIEFYRLEAILAVGYALVVGRLNGSAQVDCRLPQLSGERRDAVPVTETGPPLAHAKTAKLKKPEPAVAIHAWCDHG